MGILQPQLVALLNAEISREQVAHLSYKMLSVWADDNGFTGTKRWAARASADENDHRDKFIAYLVGYREPVDTLAASAVPDVPQTLADVFEIALKLELSVTAAISQMVAAALGAQDYRTAQFLLWFLDEQVKSEQELLDIQSWFVSFGEDGAALERIDHKIGKL